MEVKVVKNCQWFALSIDDQVYEIYFEPTNGRYECSDSLPLLADVDLWEESSWLELLVVIGITKEEMLPIALERHKRAAAEWALVVQEQTQRSQRKHRR